MYIRVIIIVIIIVIKYIYDIFYPTKQLENVFNPIKYTKRIPNIIFRTAEDKKVSSSFYTYCHQKWVELNPDYNIVWYNNCDREKFLKKFYIGDVYNAYKTLKPGAFKADLWRLCVLYKFGGVYVDMFSVPMMSIKNMIKGCLKETKNFISVLDSTKVNAIHNGFIICERNHPFLKQTIDDIVENVKKRYYGSSSLYCTGPILLARSINRVLKKNKNIHKKGWNNHGNLSYYLYKHCHGPYQYIYKDELIILYKQFSFLHWIYRKKFDKNDYDKMWYNKDVYL
jgi:mannosyltransferase OCH1-like enzyme